MADDIVKRLRVKADIIQLGESIAWGSDSEIMREAADAIDTLRRERDEAQAALADLHDRQMKLVSDRNAALALLREAKDLTKEPPHVS